MREVLARLAQTWEELAEHDPLWAVSSRPDKRGGRWELAEFMATGEPEVEHYSRLIRTQLPAVSEFAAVLDFGCGAGRLTSAWGKRAGSAVGVDVSPSMLDVARKNLTGQSNVTFVLNQSENLRVFGDGAFDLVFSLICLQHMAWPLAAGYIAEFARVCRDGGIVAFQLPSRPLLSHRYSLLRKRLVDSLPLGFGRKYRQWRHGTPVVFEMHFIDPSEVEERADRAGLTLLHREPDRAAGPGTEGFFYIFRKPVT